MRPSHLLSLATLLTTSWATAALAAPPCAGATWGEITSPSTSIHVDDAGDDKGEGTATDPVATLSEALTRSRASGVTKRIAIHPGTYDGGLLLKKTLPASATDDGLIIEGCSATEVTVVPPTGGSGDPVLEIYEADTIKLAGLKLDGGTRTLLAYAGASATVLNVVVDNAKRIGGLADGATTALTLDGTKVEDTVADSGSYGWGVAVQSATLVMDGGAVLRSVEVGLFADGADLDLSNAEIADTATNSSGYYGRGVHIQNGTTGDFYRLDLGGNTDAGFFGHRFEDIAIDYIDVPVGTNGLIPDSEETTGDGIVLTRAGSTDPVTDFVATLTGNTASYTDRAAVVLDGVDATVVSNTGSNLGGPVPPECSDPAVIYSQDSTDLDGSDTTVECRTYELPSNDELELNLATLTVDSDF